jgi:ABC-type nitrate/sulfonate/bicarbonate transport system substrate-binding protein
MRRLSRHLGIGLILASALLSGSGTEAAEKIVVGITGTPNALAWPFYIAIEKGFFAAEDITVDKIFAPSSAAVILQATAGALDMTVEGAFVDVIRAIEKGSPLAIVRILVQTPPYELLAKSSIKSLKELKGKTVSIGGPKDVTRIYRLGDCLGIAEVVLLPSRVGTHIFGWHQHGIVTKRCEFAAQMVCADASLHADQTGG